MPQADDVAARPVAASWDALDDLPVPPKAKAASAGHEGEAGAVDAAADFAVGGAEASSGAKPGGDAECGAEGKGQGEAEPVARAAAGGDGEVAAHEHVRGADAAIGSFLRHMLRRRGYHALAGTDPNAHRRLRRALDAAFPPSDPGRTDTSGRAAFRPVLSAFVVANRLPRPPSLPLPPHPSLHLTRARRRLSWCLNCSTRQGRRWSSSNCVRCISRSGASVPRRRPPAFV